MRHHAGAKRSQSSVPARRDSASSASALLRDLRRDLAAQAVDRAARVEHDFVEAPPLRAFLPARDQHAVRLEAFERRALLQVGRRERLRRASQHAMDVVRAARHRLLLCPVGGLELG
jgi:hypothetical protein